MKKKKKIIHLTIYPPKHTTHGQNVGGVASYAKNTITATKDNCDYIVLAQEINQKNKQYKEDQHLIDRCWKRDKWNYFLRIIGKLFKYRKQSNRLLVQFEFAIYGSAFKTGFFPLILVFARLLGYKLVLVQHQVVGDLSKLSNHLNLSGFKLSIYKFLMKVFFRLLISIPNTVIVFDQIHKDKLTQMQAKWKKKISVIPHGVEKQPPKKDLSISPWYKEKIGIQKEKTFDILMFGFIAGYKGSLLGAQHFFKYLEDNPKTRYRLILAGGKSPTQKDNPGYQKYFKKVVQTSQKSDRIIHTGFVPEKDLPLIHNKADLILLPYQNLMSSSGPLSLAITHQKPFLLSKALRPYTLTPDFKSAINSYLKSSYPVLEPKKGNIFKQIEQVVQDKTLLKKLKAISQELYTTRSWSSIGDKYWEIIK